MRHLIQFNRSGRRRALHPHQPIVTTFGRSDLKAPKGRGTWDKPALLEKDLVIDITGQDGRRFWGVTTLSGAGEKTDEPFISELAGKDNRSFVFADTQPD